MVYFFFALGSMICTVSTSIYGIILGRSLQGMGVIVSTVISLLSDLVREQNRVTAMTYIGISFGITFAISMILGPILMNIIGLHGLFGMIFILTLISMIVMLWIVPIPVYYHVQEKITYHNFMLLLTNKKLLKLNVNIFLLNVILISNFISFPLIMTHANMLIEKQWKMYLVTMCISFLITSPTIIYAEIKKIIRYILLIAVIFMLFAECMFFFSEKNLWIIFLGMQFFFISFNTLAILLPTLISREAPTTYRGSAISIYSTNQFLGSALGGVLGGFVIQTYGIYTIYIIDIIIALVWFVINLTIQNISYIYSFYIILPNHILINNQLIQHIQTFTGVIEVHQLLETNGIYIKIDTNKTNQKSIKKKKNKNQ